MTENKIQKFEEQLWHIIVNNQTKGPLSLRDLDVLLRTSQINSNTYVWKNGMPSWKLMNEIDEIKDSILQSSKEIFEIEKKRGEVELKDKDKKQENQQQKNQDQIIQNKDQDVMTILQATVDNLLQKTFHQTDDGKWNIYDQQKEEWIQQQQEPIQRMEKMKKDLFNKLKTQLFFDQKNNFKRAKHPVKEQDQRQLTKQQLAKKQKNKKKTKKAAEKKKQKWYQAKMNTFIYISGLPLDITEDELKQFCSKAGILRIDLNTGSEKIKIYKDETGIPKGDAAVSFARVESVQIALELLNGAEIRSGFNVKVQRAQFQQKAEQYVPRETKKQSKVKKIQAKLLQNKLYGWNEDDQQRGQGLKILIIKNVFTPDMIQKEEQLERIKQEIRKQLESFGQIKRIRYFQTHPEGVVEVKFKLEKDAETCVEAMDRKSFNGQQLQCDYWDGQTDYKRNSVSLMLQDQRLNKFASELEQDKKVSDNVEVTQNGKQGSGGNT